jgi:mannose-6-phosphate isomerase-like protein (cupin superfamily)
MGTVMRFPTETFEVLANPGTTGDRYRIGLTAPAGGGPGIKGDGPHTHPGLIDIFRVVSGQMTARVGRDLFEMRPGDRKGVPAGVAHGFVNSGDELLEVEVDVVYTPPGLRAEADATSFARIVAGLIEDGHVSHRTGHPSLSQIAVLLADRSPEAMAQPGLGGALMGRLAACGRFRGMRTRFPEYESRGST